MALSSSLFHHYRVLCIFILVACFATPIVCHEKHQVSLFVFGDSLFDPGNNNYINTTTEYQANWWPYGESFFNKYPATGRASEGRLVPEDYVNTTTDQFQSSWWPYEESFNYPTGRFSDGRLIPDFIAEYANMPFIPPYFQIGQQHFGHGVNFASGGSGCLVEAHRGFVIDLKTQLKYYKNVAQLLKKKVDATESKQILSNAVYIFSTGNNDYLAPFSTNSTFPYSNKEYLQMVMDNLTSVLKGIYKEGGRKFAMLSLVPLGCLPAVRALNVQRGVKNGICIEEITNLAKMHNAALPEMLKELEKQLPGFKYTLFDLFNVFSERIDNPRKHGFKTSKTACCGTDPFRGIYSCGGKRQVKEYELCNNMKDYLFFDSFHPTELAYQQFAELLWNGTPDVVAPYNLKSFFELQA